MDITTDGDRTLDRLHILLFDQHLACLHKRNDGTEKGRSKTTIQYVYISIFIPRGGRNK